MEMNQLTGGPYILPSINGSESSYHVVTRKPPPSEIRDLLDNLVTKLSSSGMTKEKEDAVEQIHKKILKIYSSMIQNQIIVDAVYSACSSRNPRVPTVEKMAQVVATEELESIATINTNESVNTPLTWLGVKIGNSPELSAWEKMEIQLLVEGNIASIGAKLKNVCNDNAVTTRKLNIKKQEVKDILADIHQSIPLYNTEVYRYISTVQGIIDYRERSCLMNSCNEKWVNVKSQSLSLKARLLHQKYLFTFYTEDPKIPEALSVLKSCLQIELENLKPELLKLRSDINDYAKLKDTEYEKVLQEYIEVLKTIKEKKWTLKVIN